ncbi:hypothetical protein BAC2_00922 [uncultured bacterium]|nr:hypothetical protein BAC2_00922 [uncultured bacterium]
MHTRYGLLVSVLLLLSVACTPTAGGATALLPDVPNTTVINGQSISDFIAKLADGAALTSANPELILLIEKAEGTLACLQQTGAVAARTYTDKTFPLSAGFVAVIDKNAITNLANWQQCLTGRANPSAQAVTLQPCATTYTLKKDNNEFFIAYAATTAEMCQAFCSRLEGCQQ